MYEFSYALDDTDYLNFNIYHYNNSPYHKRMLRLTRSIVPVMFIISLVSIYIRDGFSAALLVLFGFYAVISVLWFFVSKLINEKMIGVMIRKMKKDGKLPYGKNVRLRFDEQGIFETTEVSESKFPYSRIEKTVVSGNMVYVYIGVMQAFIIPASVFKDERQKADFLKFIDEKRGS